MFVEPYSPIDVDALFARLEKVIGEDRITARLARLRRSEMQMYKDSMLLTHWFVPTNILWSTLRGIKKTRAKGGSINHACCFISDANKDLFEVALDSATAIVTAAEMMGEVRRNKLLSDVCAVDELKPVLLECEAANFWSSHGFEIEWLDDTGKEGLPSAEFLAKKGELVFAVECKALATDAGRRLHRKHILALADELFHLLPPLRGHVDITMEGQFPVTPDERKAAVNLLLPMFKTGRIEHADQKFVLSGELFPHEGLEINKEQFIQGWEKNRLDRFSYRTVRILQKDGKLYDPLSIRFIYPLKDKVTENIRDKLREAAEQLKASELPGFIQMYLPSITDFSVEGIKEYTLEIKEWLFADGSQRDHIFACGFKSDTVRRNVGGRELMVTPGCVILNPRWADFEALSYLRSKEGLYESPSYT